MITDSGSVACRSLSNSLNDRPIPTNTWQGSIRYFPDKDDCRHMAVTHDCGLRRTHVRERTFRRIPTQFHSHTISTSGFGFKTNQQGIGFPSPSMLRKSRCFRIRSIRVVTDRVQTTRVRWARVSYYRKPTRYRADKRYLLHTRKPLFKASKQAGVNGVNLCEGAHLPHHAPSPRDSSGSRRYSVPKRS